MVLSLLYAKNGHTYKKKFRSYKDMDIFAEKVKKQGYKIVGGNIYRGE